MTKEDYMKLPKETLAEELARRDLISSPSPFVPLTLNQLNCFEDFRKCINPHHDCMNCPHRFSTGGEQSSEKTCKDCGFYENNCPYIRGKFIPYPSKVCEDYTYSVIKAQEQPSEDLEEAAEEYRQGEVDTGCDYIDDSNGDSLYYSACLADAFIAGAERQKEQMLKDAVEGVVYRYESYQRIATAIIVDIPRENFGNKVKVIIVKEDKE